MSGEEVWSERSELGEVRSQNQLREIEKKREKIALRLYIGNHDSQWIERC